MSEQNTILIVEDESSLRDALRSTLEMQGFAILTAGDGVSALEIAFREHPDLILLDIILPKMDGLTFAKKLREDAWGKTVPVIILTNLSDASEASDAVDQAIQHNIFDYLVKSDWQLEDVVARIKERLRKE